MAADTKQERTAAKLARQIGAFSKEHGGAEGQLAYIGQAGTRIVLVGEDGGWGDLVAPTREVARLAAEKAGLTLQDAFDGEMAAKVKTGPYEWTRMAGIQLGGPRNSVAVPVAPEAEPEAVVADAEPASAEAGAAEPAAGAEPEAAAGDEPTKPGASA